jgi:hypothetical protein
MTSDWMYMMHMHQRLCKRGEILPVPRLDSLVGPSTFAPACGDLHVRTNGWHSDGRQDERFKRLLIAKQLYSSEMNT